MVDRDPLRKVVRELAHDSIERGEYVAWFEELYSRAAVGEAVVPWADKHPNPNLVTWMAAQRPSGANKRALVVGCGLGDDAVALAELGYDTTGFDVSPTAIEGCHERFADAGVHFEVADAFDPPPHWSGAFDFVLEVYTLQAIPPRARAGAFASIAGCVAPGGELLVIARARDDDQDPGDLPWPLSPSELARFEEAGLTRLQLDDYPDDEDPPVRRFRAHYRRPAAG